MEQGRVDVDMLAHYIDGAGWQMAQAPKARHHGAPPRIERPNTLCRQTSSSLSAVMRVLQASDSLEVVTFVRLIVVVEEAFLLRYSATSNDARL